jgi:Tfp pilus assembly protein PilW
MSRRSSLRSSDGFTAVETLVALTLSLGTMTAVTALAVSSRNLYRSDEARTRLNQDLRSARDLIVADVLSAGEGLAHDFPAILVADGGSDRLTLRRNLVAVVLPVCATVAGVQIQIADPNPGPPLGCEPVTDADVDGWPDNLEVFREHRQSRGGSANAYIYDPVTQEGELFRYVQEDALALTVSAAAGTSWANAYPATDQCRLYLLEERRYELAGDLLQLVIDGDTANPLDVAYGFHEFQVAATLRDGTQLVDFGVGDDWSALASIDLRFAAETVVRGRVVERRLESEVLPRNALSR